MQPELSPEQLAPELISTGAQAIVDNAERLGLKWQLRLATVLNGASPTTVNSLYDGDSEPIAMTSMIGPVPANARVYVIQVPPSGNFIVGTVTNIYTPTWGIGNQTGTLGTTGVEAAIPLASWAEEPYVAAPPSMVMKVTIAIPMFIGSATNSVIAVRLRKGSVTVSGTQLNQWFVDMSSITTVAVVSNLLVGYFKNTSSSSVNSSKLSVTITAQTGAASCSVYSDGNFPLTVEVKPYQPTGIDAFLDARCVTL